MAEGVKKTFDRLYRLNLGKALNLLCNISDYKNKANELIDYVQSQSGMSPRLYIDESYVNVELGMLSEMFDIDYTIATKCHCFAYDQAVLETDRATYQSMEALIHNLNTMHSRAGAQVPFSSINYGMDTSPEGRMVIKNLLLATEAGLGYGETPIFPIQIFRVKEGVNFNPEDVNYPLFKLAMRCSAKRLFPNFSFQDAPFNIAYYKGTPETEIAYMG